MATLSSYTQLVQNEVDDTSSASQSIVQQAIKETYQEFLRQIGRFIVPSVTDNVAVSAGNSIYTASSEVVEYIGVYYKSESDSSFRELKFITQEQYFETRQNQEAGNPYEYYLDASNIVLAQSPTESGTLRIVYRPLVAELTATSIIPERFTRVIVLGACYRFFGYEKGPEAENYKNWYHEATRDAILEYSLRNFKLRQ